MIPTPAQGQTTGSITNGHWVCFKAKNSLGVYGYADIQVRITTTSNPIPTTPSPETLLPVIVLRQQADTVEATGDDLLGFAYFKAATKPVCSEANDQVSYRAGAIATGLSHGQWVCFKAKNALDVYGYAKLEVDLTQPVIHITQSADQLLASAKTSKPTIVSDTWQNFISEDAEPNCNNDDVFSSSQASNNSLSINESNNNQWACFRVKNIKGVWGYAKHQISISVSQSETAPVNEVAFPDTGQISATASQTTEQDDSDSQSQQTTDDDSQSETTGGASTTTSGSGDQGTESDQGCQWWLGGLFGADERCLKFTQFDYLALLFLLLLLGLLLIFIWYRRKSKEDPDNQASD